jgi:hypothetical protein
LAVGYALRQSIRILQEEPVLFYDRYQAATNELGFTNLNFTIVNFVSAFASAAYVIFNVVRARIFEVRC